MIPIRYRISQQPKNIEVTVIELENRLEITIINKNNGKDTFRNYWYDADIPEVLDNLKINTIIDRAISDIS